MVQNIIGKDNRSFAKQVKVINYDEVKAGNYTILNGTWQNSESKNIMISNQMMQFQISWVMKGHWGI
ncbi:hypothetical protein [Latilactobacillus sakei]|uniref:Uncharacterized protein n=1 Tax=Latilactobacillus sakei TaxID=1599 RepID=A0AAF0K3Z5_LATSK|nr:hypothetical protein [Latilactobacillus sakei]WGI19021.1 hypothetical protein QBD03_09795 [Latilactobacillus sakei]